MLQTKYPREYGVVSFRNNEEHAIAPARVLFGIVAGTIAAPATVPVSELLKLSSHQVEGPVARSNNDVNTLLAVTLADIYAYGE